MQHAGGRDPRKAPPIAYFRNDDVNELSSELIAISELLWEANVPVIHTVEPGNVTDECVAWLLEMKAKHGRLLEIMQHGYDHTKHDKGEFGGSRGYDEQHADLKRGMAIMDERFGDQWFRCVNFPFGPYNRDTLRAVDDLGFLVFNGHFNPRPSRRMFYKVGHALRRGQIKDKHISYHLGHYPGVKAFPIDMVITYIAKYTGAYGSQSCDFHDLDFLMQRFEAARRHINVIGWLLHHRYHHTEAGVAIVRDSIDEMRRRLPEIEFWNFEEIYRAFGPATAAS